MLRWLKKQDETMVLQERVEISASSESVRSGGRTYIWRDVPIEAEKPEPRVGWVKSQQIIPHPENGMDWIKVREILPDDK